MLSCWHKGLSQHTNNFFLIVRKSELTMVKQMNQATTQNYSPYHFHHSVHWSVVLMIMHWGESRVDGELQWPTAIKDRSISQDPKEYLGELIKKIARYTLVCIHNNLINLSAEEVRNIIVKATNILVILSNAKASDSTTTVSFYMMGVSNT